MLSLNVLGHKVSFKSVMTYHKNGTAKYHIFYKMQAKDVICQQAAG
jgi:hypothetical protein